MKFVLLSLAILVAGVGGGVKLLASPPAQFRVDGTEIHGPSGNEPFVPVGMNLLGPDGFFNDAARTRGLASVLRDDWNINTVRLNACLPTGCPYTDVRNRKNDDLAGIVREYTRKHIVVILALHQVEPGGMPSGGELGAIEAWWRLQAQRYKGNPWVWFNVLNEPGHGKPMPSSWLTVHERLIRAIRDEGAHNIVVVDGGQWGQEVGGLDDGKVDAANSAILTYGPRLAKELDGLVFSFHVYDQWGQPADASARDARMADYIDRVHAAGLPLMIGEVGGAWKECCERSALAAQTAYRVAPPRGVGILAWHGQAIDQYKLVNEDPPTSPADIDDRFDPTNLTWQGELLWKLAHR